MSAANQGGGEEREKAKRRREPENLSRGRGSLHSGSAQVNSETGLIEGEEEEQDEEKRMETTLAAAWLFPPLRWMISDHCWHSPDTDQWSTVSAEEDGSPSRHTCFEPTSDSYQGRRRRKGNPG